jgi:hypothetical protein
MKIKRVGHRRQRPTDSDTSEDIEKKFTLGHFFYRVLWKKDIDEIDNLFAPNATITGFNPYFCDKSWEIVGLEEMKDSVRHFLDAFSSVHFYIMDMSVPRRGFGNPNLVLIRFRVRGKNDMSPLWNIRMSFDLMFMWLYIYFFIYIYFLLFSSSFLLFSSSFLFFFSVR